MRTILILIVVLFLFLSVGCQMDVGGSIGAKAFYPDQWKQGGDPRRPMYEGSGYAERHVSGSQSEYQGFRGLAAN